MPAKTLVLDGDRGGPVNNLCVISEVAPSYAPRDRSLVSISVMGPTDSDEARVEREVREQLTGWFGKQVHDWRPLRRYRVARALPDLPPRGKEEPFAHITSDSRVLVCGDHLARGSIEGAMVSGRRAAEAILESEV